MAGYSQTPFPIPAPPARLIPCTGTYGRTPRGPVRNAQTQTAPSDGRMVDGVNLGPREHSATDPTISSLTTHSHTVTIYNTAAASLILSPWPVPQGFPRLHLIIAPLQTNDLRDIPTTRPYLANSTLSEMPYVSISLAHTARTTCSSNATWVHPEASSGEINKDAQNCSRANR